jgi:hypothetical protein
MGFGFGGGCDFNRCNSHRDQPRREENQNNNNNGNPELLQFLRALTPELVLLFSTIVSRLQVQHSKGSKVTM